MILRGMSADLGHQLGHHLGHVSGMSGTTSGAYCQQWTTICGATCICDAVFNRHFHKIVPAVGWRMQVNLKFILNKFG